MATFTGGRASHVDVRPPAVRAGGVPEGRNCRSAATVRSARRRLTLGGCGCVLMALGAMGFPAADAAHFGWTHATPNIVLVEVLRWFPDRAVQPGIELRGRIGRGALRPWERRELA